MNEKLFDKVKTYLEKEKSVKVEFSEHHKGCDISGYGELLIKSLNSSYPNLQFKVNPRNRNSINFFDTILFKGIISKKVFNKDGYIYST